MWRTRGTTSRSPGRGRAVGALPVRRGARPATCAGDWPSAHCRFAGAGTAAPAAPGADCGDCRRRPRARPPTRVVGMSAGCPHRRALLTLCMGYRHRRALLTPARVISPSRCQQPPHDVNDPLTVPTTRARADDPLAVLTARTRAHVRSGGADGGWRASAPTCVPGRGRERGRALRPKVAHIIVLEAPRGGPPSSARCRCPQCAPEERRMEPRPPQPPLSARRRPRPGRSAPPRRRRPA